MEKCRLATTFPCLLLTFACILLCPVCVTNSVRRAMERDSSGANLADTSPSKHMQLVLQHFSLLPGNTNTSAEVRYCSKINYIFQLLYVLRWINLTL